MYIRLKEILKGILTRTTLQSRSVHWILLDISLVKNLIHIKLNTDIIIRWQIWHGLKLYNNECCAGCNSTLPDGVNENEKGIHSFEESSPKWFLFDFENLKVKHNDKFKTIFQTLSWKRIYNDEANVLFIWVNAFTIHYSHLKWKKSVPTIDILRVTLGSCLYFLSFSIRVHVLIRCSRHSEVIKFF